MCCNVNRHFVNYLLRNARKKLKDELEMDNSASNQQKKSKKESKEIILLRDYRWLLMKIKDDISYSLYSHYHRKLGMNLNTSQIEKMFFAIDPRLERMRNLKEKYISFNSASYSSEDEIKSQLNQLITEYEKSDLPEFNEFALYLVRFYDNIIRSFRTVKVLRKSKKDLDDY